MAAKAAALTVVRVEDDILWLKRVRQAPLHRRGKLRDRQADIEAKRFAPTASSE
jgi:hypothetical protein